MHGQIAHEKGNPLLAKDVGIIDENDTLLDASSYFNIDVELA